MGKMLIDLLATSNNDVMEFLSDEAFLCNCLVKLMELIPLFCHILQWGMQVIKALMEIEIKEGNL